MQTKQLSGDKLQAIARNYFTSRNENDFNDYYNAFYDYVRQVARRIFNKDIERVNDVASAVFVKMWKSDTYVFDESKSHKAYLFLVTLNMCKIEWNKIYKKGKSDDENMQNFVKRSKRVLSFSDIFNEDSETGSALESLLFHHKLEVTEIDDRLTEIENSFGGYVFDESVTNKFNMAVKSIRESHKNKDDFDANLIIDAMMRDGKYEDLAQKYKLNSEGAIKSRVFRIKSEIKNRLNEVENYKKLKENEKVNGVVRTFYEPTVDELANGEESTGYATREIANFTNGILNGTYQRFSRTGELIVSTEYRMGIKHGDFRKFDDSLPLVEGSYFDGKKEGIWKTFNQGKLEVYEEYENGKLCYWALYDLKGVDDKNILKNEIFE